MKISVVTLFPEVLNEFIAASIIGRAVDDGLVTVQLVQLREFALDRYKKCDDYPFGGGPGMVLKPEPLIGALEKLDARGKRVICTCPGGRLFNQHYAQTLAGEKELVLICGHYEGIDQRVIDYYVTDEISIGDFVLSGGESAAMVIIDSVVRLIPGVINPESLENESFVDGLVEYPHYTRPQSFLGMNVPDVLLSGHHEEIREWRLRKSVEKTMKNRPDLFQAIKERPEVKEILGESEGENNGSHKGG